MLLAAVRYGRGGSAIEGDLMQMRRLRFVIGRAFPAEDPIARFVTVLSQAHNDFVRVFEQLSNAKPDSDEPEDQAVRILGLRLNAASHAEASAFLRDALRRWPAIKRFVDELGDDVLRDVEHVIGVTDPKSAHYLAWLEPHRNVTFHYAEMHPLKADNDNEEIQRALRRARANVGTITDPGLFGGVRFGFADEVAVQWLPGAYDHDDPTPATIEDAEALAKANAEESKAGLREDNGVADLRDSALALMRIARASAVAYIDRLPAGAAQLERL
jgi:hypothetical protein